MSIAESKQLTDSRRILLADDNEGDVVLLELALTSQSIPIQVEIIREGDAVLERLKKLTDSPDRMLELVILDRNLPQRSAEEIMVILSQQPRLLDVPVLVYSSFISERQRKRLHELGVTAVLDKPSDWDGYLQFASGLSTWCAHGTEASA